MKILIPTCLDRDQIAPLVTIVEAYTFGVEEVFASCLKASAAVNRNACLDRLEIGEVACMLDDDVTGFTAWWLDNLVWGLDVPNSVVVSARLLKPNGHFGQTSSDCYAPAPDEISVKMLPTAAIAFRYTGVRFDEAYVGSGFEDTDWIRQIQAADPNAVLVQSNRCRLVHMNQQKNQRGENWDHNLAYFRKKWGLQ